MEIFANERKIINTAPLDQLFTQGETGVDRVAIILPQRYGDTDLSSLDWSIQLVGEDGSPVSKPLAAETGDGNLTLFWQVDADCTASAGKVSITLTGASSDGGKVIKYDGRSITVKKAKDR